MIGEISRLPFGPLWSWTNKPTDEEGHKAKTLCYALKRYQVFNKDLDAIKMAVDSLDSRMGSLPFSDFFSGEVALVPIPSSKPTRPDDVWVSRDICDEMEKRGLGLKLELLKRAYPIRRSSLSPPGERPSPIEHYNSMRGRKIERIPTRVILVDDVITKGHTMLGSA
ncbi:MAG: phosphoribosyltransferase [Aigarchaeota archaeon]|nr:phosphoribosyltransferase [Aigarchaeota archaeon]MCS7127428.1 phosphoribosyltransferase [Candidatus Calditenuaceae archaeon]MDW8042780.1 phosphoribosyltransferase [Nitrososphaerota archaeon]